MEVFNGLLTNSIQYRGKSEPTLTLWILIFHRCEIDKQSAGWSPILNTSQNQLKKVYSNTSIYIHLCQFIAEF
ncbi:hypothetical protein HNY73_013136 [Argiope bruennichi]|uniref:Uncharacterized protein n=1 Tax=Argiope bruennichi TaxID=94029 RepID=A0A8T0EX34_ARGBR|nr:hypothetical protein HNY73_013136 [Argiope bruennichi]